MSTWASRLLAACGAVGVAAALTTASTTAAFADNGPISVNTGDGWTTHPDQPLFDLTGIEPGWSSRAVVSVRNDSGHPASLSVAAAEIVDDENGCTAEESLVDTTCSGTNAGELGRRMTVTVLSAAEGTSTPAATVFSGSVDDLATAKTLATDEPAGSVSSYTIVVALPRGTGNETQSDRVSFDLQLRLTGDGVTGVVSVKGSKFVRGPGVVTRVLDVLPFTGSPVLRLVAAALWLLLAGGVLVTYAAVGRRRRRFEVEGEG
jgi:hypothetical protein